MSTTNLDVLSNATGLERMLKEFQKEGIAVLAGPVISGIINIKFIEELKVAKYTALWDS